MFFLKSLTFIPWNIVLGILTLYSLEWFLFNNKCRKCLGIRIPFTPGYLVRKREWLFDKVRDILHDYLEQAEDKLRRDGYLAKWERLIREAVFEKTTFVDGWMLLPAKWKEKIRNMMADTVKDIVSKILRQTVPHFVEQWRIEHRIDDYDEEYNIGFIKKYWRRYVFKYMFWAFLITNALIGINNLIWFLIIG